MIDPEKPSRETQSFWMQATPSPQESQGVEDHTADVCVVGAGIAGLTTAHLLSQEGLNVTVLEAQKVGYGQTLRTTAHASNVLDEGFVQLERVHGPQGAQLAARSHKEAMNRIAQLADEIGSDCDPWQGQSQVVSMGFHRTTHPMCVQAADLVWTTELWSLLTAIFLKPFCSTTPSPGRRDSATSGLSRRSHSP